MLAFISYPQLQRYLLAEGLALVGAWVAITLAQRLTDNTFLLVAVSVYSGSASYYTTLFVQMLRVEWASQPSRDLHSRMSVVGATLNSLVMQFGRAELVDGLLMSPLLLYLCLQLLPSQQLAVLVSELLSTLAFYATVLIAQRVGQRAIH